MNELDQIEKKRTILLFISILLVSIYSIYAYSVGENGIEINRLIKQLIRFSLTVGLLIMIYKGKRWAKIILIILFSLLNLGILLALDSASMQFTNKIPFLVMIFVYLMAIYHFGFSKSFKAFFEHQNNKKNEVV